MRTKRKGKPAKLDHGAISNEIIEKPIGSIMPSPENEKLYRPVCDNDPDVIALSESIRKHGVKDVLVISLDGYIVSGHRRHMAAKLAGLKTVPCRVENIRSTDPGFIEMLREYNRQRIKTLAEIAREEIVPSNPEEAYRLLVKHRRMQSGVDVDTIDIVGEKRRAEISEAKHPFLDAIQRILSDRRQFWPLSVRQIHYALLNDPPLIHARKPASRYSNTMKSYKAAIDLIARARIAGLIPWDSIDDETRTVTTWNAFSSIAPFVQGELDSFLKGYYRDLLQSQPNHIEIVGEKNTIKGIIRPVAMEYRIPFMIGRGYSSLPPRQKMAQRYRKSGKDKLIVLLLSDFDPEGEDIAHSFARSMRDDFGIEEIVPIKVALTRDQVDSLSLPPVMKAKDTSSRHDKFVELHGEDVFELEAVPPDELQLILRGAIDNVLDVKAFNAEIDAEKRDAAKLDGMRRAVKQQLVTVNFD